MDEFVNSTLRVFVGRKTRFLPESWSVLWRGLQGPIAR
jgi:hypothetical protein